MSKELKIDETGALVIEDEEDLAVAEEAFSNEFGVEASMIVVPSLGHRKMLHIPGRGLIALRRAPVGVVKRYKPGAGVTKCEFVRIRRPELLYHLRTWDDFNGENPTYFFTQDPASRLDASFVKEGVYEDWELLGVKGIVWIPPVTDTHTTPLTSATADQLYSAIRKLFDGHMTIRIGDSEIIKRFPLENIAPQVELKVLQDDGTTYRVMPIAKPRKHIMFTDLLFNLRHPLVLRKDERFEVEFQLRSAPATTDMPAGPTASNEWRTEIRVGVSFIGNREFKKTNQ